MKFVKPFFYLISIIFYLVVFSFPVLASTPPFSINLDIQYRLNAQGRAFVRYNFQIINQEALTAPVQFTLSPGFKKISNARAIAEESSLPLEMVSAEEAKIQVRFPAPPIGPQGSFTGAITFETEEVAQKQGRLWRIRLPRRPDLPGRVSFREILSVPVNFGRAIALFPQPAGENEYIWTDKEAGEGDVFLYLDPTNSDPAYQTVSFRLHYPLANTRLYPVSQEILLPRDTAAQKVFLHDLAPRPAEVRQDENGNWLAKFSLGPVGRIEAVASGSALLASQPRFSFLKTPPGLVAPKHLDPALATLARAFSSPAHICQFAARQNPDPAPFFALLARSAGTPARTVSGINLETSTLSSWAEYYSPPAKNWQEIDPVFYRLTLRREFCQGAPFMHLALAVYDADAGLPAGEFPDLGSSEVLFTGESLDPVLSPRLTLRADVPPVLTAGFPGRADVYLENNGPTVFAGDSVYLDSQRLTREAPFIASGPIPPFGVARVSFLLATGDWREPWDDIITLRFTRYRREYPISVRPVFKNKTIILVCAFFTLGFLSILAQIARSLFFLRRKKASSLHR